jgi:hypothetical protein
MLKMDVANGLAYRFAEIPLIFPITLLEARDYTTPLGTSSIINTAMTISLVNADACYTIFKEHNIYSTQCFTNPCINYGLLIAGKYYPRENYNTIDDHRNWNQTLDALNVNNSNMTSIHDDMRSSIQPYTKCYKYDADAKKSTEYRWTMGDHSNFANGTPFCDSEVFQGGITTGSIQIQLIGQRLTVADVPLTKTKIDYQQPVGIFTQDALMKIRSIKPAGKPQIEITNARVEQVVGTM